MACKQSVPVAMWEVGRAQAGMLNHRQVAGFGFTRNSIQRLFDDRVLWRIARGLYSFAPDPSWEALAWGGVLLGGEDAVLGFTTAGFLHGLSSRPRRIDILVPRRAMNRQVWRFHRTHPPGGVGSPARTDLEETALALCSTGRQDDVVGTLTRALGTRRTSTQRLRRRVEDKPNLPHRRLILDVLSDLIDEGAHSALEARYLRDVEQAHGLPVAHRQLSVSLRTRSDCVYESYRLIVELDGELWHEGLAAMRDIMRDQEHGIDGWLTLRFSWFHLVNMPCRVAQIVAGHLRQRGWSGELTRCASC